MGNPTGVRRDFDALEKRRFAAMRLLGEGLNQSEVARRVKVARQTVARWAQQCRSEGKQALKKAGRAGRRRFFPMPVTSRREFLARALFVVLLATALPVLAQVPGDFVKITNLELSSGTPTLEYENVGQKPVTAFAIENLTGEHKGELV